MSDAMAEKAQEENAAQKEVGKQASEAQQKRLWMVMLILDPESGEFAMQPNANVTKQWQLDALISAAEKQGNLTATAKVVGGLISKILEAKKGRKLFGG